MGCREEHSGEQLGRERCGSSEQQAEHQLAVCPCSKGSWLTGHAGVQHQEEYCQQVDEGDPSPLLSIGEAVCGVLCPVIGSPVQQTHGHAGESPAKGHKDEQGTGASLP